MCYIHMLRACMQYGNMKDIELITNVIIIYCYSRSDKVWNLARQIQMRANCYWSKTCFATYYKSDNLRQSHQSRGHIPGYMWVFQNNNLFVKCKFYVNINWRDVQRKKVNNVDRLSLRAPWQYSTYKNKHRTVENMQHSKT